MICRFCGQEMHADVGKYYLCYHCGTQVSYNQYDGSISWEKERLKVKVKTYRKEASK